MSFYVISDKLLKVLIVLKTLILFGLICASMQIAEIMKYSIDSNQHLIQ